MRGDAQGARSGEERLKQGARAVCLSGWLDLLVTQHRPYLSTGPRRCWEFWTREGGGCQSEAQREPARSGHQRDESEQRQRGVCRTSSLLLSQDQRPRHAGEAEGGTHVSDVKLYCMYDDVDDAGQGRYQHHDQQQIVFGSSRVPSKTTTLKGQRGGGEVSLAMASRLPHGHSHVDGERRELESANRTAHE